MILEIDSSLHSYRVLLRNNHGVVKYNRANMNNKITQGTGNNSDAILAQSYLYSVWKRERNIWLWHFSLKEGEKKKKIFDHDIASCFIRINIILGGQVRSEIDVEWQQELNWNMIFNVSSYIYFIPRVL